MISKLSGFLLVAILGSFFFTNNPIVCWAEVNVSDTGFGTGDHWLSIEHDSGTRRFLLHIPPGYSGETAVPLLISLHGGGANAEHQMKTSQANELSDEEGFIVVYPNGSGWSKNMLLTWNSGRCCKYAKDNNIDDVGFIRELIEKLMAEMNIDPARIYATGFSNGGMMAHRLGCELSDLIAAIAPVAGALDLEDDGECLPKSVTPSVIIFHGTEDDNVRYGGGVGKKAVIKDPRKPVSFSVESWVALNSCPEKPAIEEKGNIKKETYGECKNGGEVVLYTINGGAHAWPGGKRVFRLEDKPTKELSATEIMWEFFKRHPMSNPGEKLEEPEKNESE